MLSHKQGKYLAVLLAVGSIYVPYVLASLFILIAPFIALDRAYSTPGPNPFGLAVVWLVAICDLLLIVGITVLAVRTITGNFPLARFLAGTVFSFLVFFAVGYATMVMANVALGMGWSIL